MERLIGWARDHGATFEASPDADHPRRLFAARDLSPGDVMFSIPEPLLLYGARAYEDAEYGAAFRRLQDEAGAALDQRSLLVLLLVVEKCRGEASHFAPYVDMLPAAYDDPFWWSEPELQLLRGTRLHKAVAHYTAGLQQLHEWMLRLEHLHQQQQQQPGSSTLSSAQGGWGLTHAAVKWARSAVWSRAFTVKGLDIGSNRRGSRAAAAAAPAAGAAAAAAAHSADAADSGAAAADAAAGGGGDDSGLLLDPVIALVPVLDMCDHHPQQRVSWRTVRLEGQQSSSQQQQQQQQRQQQAFQFTSLSPVAKGAELFNNYGTTKPNEELLLGFGFVLDPNPNDSYLITVSNPQQGMLSSTAAAAALDSVGAPTSAAADSAGMAAGVAQEQVQEEGAEEEEEEACDAAAVWQRRLAAMAARGLRLDVPVTAAEPLPAQLLDVMLLAAALPAWALDTCSTCQPAAAHAAAVEGSPAGVEAASRGGSQQQQGLFAATPLPFQLQALLLLRQQLTAKLQGMVPEQQQLQIIQHTQADAGGLQQQQQQQQQLEDAAGAGPLQGMSPHNARMAAVYVLSQQRLLQQALAAAARQVEVCLQQAAASSSTTQQQQPLGVPAAAEPPATAASAAPAGVRLHHSLELCCCCNVLSVQQGAGPCSGSAGGTVPAVPAGAVLIDAALESCAAAGSEGDLILLLMSAAAAVQQQQQEEQEAAPTQPSEQQPEEAWAQYYGRLWLSQWTGAAAGFEQVLPWWLVPHNRELVGLLQDTPAEQQLQQAVAEDQQDFGAFLGHLQAAAAPAADSTAGTAIDNRPNGSAAATAGTAACTGDKQQLLRRQQVLQLANLQPLVAYSMFCWAQALVRQAAVEPVVVQQQQQQQQPAGQDPLLVLVPGLEHVPEAMRDLLLKVELVDDHNPQQQQQQQQQEEAGQQACGSGRRVLVSSRAALPTGLQLSHAALAGETNVQQLLIDRGPAALQAAAGSAVTAAATAAVAATAGVGSKAAPTAALVDSDSRAVSGALSSNSTNSLRHVFELNLIPSKSDPLRPQKLQLLSAAGLGLCHHLTATSSGSDCGSSGSSPEKQQLGAAGCKAVLTAMAVCLLAAEDPAQQQLASPEGAAAVAQEQQAALQAAGVLSSSTALAAATAAGEPAAGHNAPPRAGDGPGAESQQAKGSAWGCLQERVLQQTGKEARKELLQVLKADRQAVKAAHKQAKGQAQQVPGAGGALQRPAVGRLCRTCSSAPADTPGRLQQAAQGMCLYLQGFAEVLGVWVELLSEAKPGSGGGVAGSKKKSEAEAEGSSKRSSKKKKQG